MATATERTRFGVSPMVNETFGQHPNAGAGAGGQPEEYHSLLGKKGGGPKEDSARGQQMALFLSGMVLIIAILILVIIYSKRQVLIVTASLSLVGYLMSIYFAREVPTEPAMIAVSDAIRLGASGFLNTQFKTIGYFAVIVAILLIGIYYVNPLPAENKDVNVGLVPWFTGLCFVLGATCSAMSGYIGMWVSVRSNIRVAGAAKTSYGEAITIAMRGGTSSGLLVVGMVVIGLTFVFTMAHVFFPSLSHLELAPHIVGFGFGASLVALFAQLGGGIYTKAADVGADIVGKIETNIPEDDPRNPAVIADLVGDNVGDCAGRGADLFESISAEIIGAMILGGKLAKDLGLEEATFLYFPLLVHSFDLIVSSIGTLCVREMSSMRRRGEVREPPIRILARGFIISLLFAFGGFVIASRWLLYTDKYPDAWWRFLCCGGVGMLLALFFLLLTEYYTGYHHAPVGRIAKASTTGDGTNVIAGLSVGMESAGIPVVLITIGIISSYNLGNWAIPHGGLFGTAVATMGMLSIAAFVLGMDTFGPITDNAGGIAEMSGQSARVREITDELDAVGNTTKALTKGWAIGSAGLAAFLLFQAYVDVVNQYSTKQLKSVDLSMPEVFSCGLLGAGLVVVFSSMAIRAVGTAAGDVVEEVRRQLRAHPGIMTGQDLPDYGECVSMIHKASLREMIKPGLTAVTAPVIVALAYRALGVYTNNELLAAESLGGFLMVATTTGIVFSLFLNNAGGAWDNAKKLIETGLYGGKGSPAHKAAVTGDCVGDPCKDTAGPSIHVLIKLLSTITLVLGPLFL